MIPAAASLLVGQPAFGEIPAAGLFLPGKADAAAAINQALATGRDIELPEGRYLLRDGWVEMKIPGQVLRCKGPNTVLIVDRPGTSAAPALVMMQSAIGAKVVGCKIDMNGAQFINTAFLPLAADDAIAYVPGKGLANNPRGKTIQNDGVAATVLVMCDRCEIVDTEVTRGFDNNIMVANFDLANGRQSLGPWGVSIRDTRTSQGGSGRHDWSPDFYLGCGIDVGTGVATRLSNVEDRYSRVGFCVDEGGGASAQIVNAISYYAQMTPQPFTQADKMSAYYPAPDDPWHGSSIAGSGFFFGGSNRRADLGQVQRGLISTTCANCLAYEPQGVGFWFSRYSNGVHLVSPHAASPGLECFWALGGTHYLTDAICDQPNALKASTAIWGKQYPWPQADAVRAICSNCPPFASDGLLRQAIQGTKEQLNTTLHFNGLTVTGPGKLDSPNQPKFGYALSTAAQSNGEAPSITVNGGTMQSGESGRINEGSGSSITILNISKEK